MARGASSGWTYAKAGVDRGDVATALRALLDEVRYRPPPSHGVPVRLPGHYAGLVRVGRETIAITTDTVGTKVLIAEATGSWEGVGEDLVAINVNDLASVGARPCGLVDVISCPSPEPQVLAALGRGIDRGLAKAKCALLGGETAVVPSIVRGTDLGATAIGFFPRDRAPVTGARIRPGDLLLGVPASGFHANGFTLLRRLIEEGRVPLDRPRPGGRRPLAEELLEPTRTFVPVSEALAGRPTTHGLAHLSGGGVRNLVRLHDGVRFLLDRWPEPPGLFRWAAELGGLAAEEQFQTFNMGIGFIVVSDPRGRSETLRRLARAGAPDAVVVGHVERGRGVAVPRYHVEFEGYG